MNLTYLKYGSICLLLQIFIGYAAMAQNPAITDLNYPMQNESAVTALFVAVRTGDCVAVR